MAVAPANPTQITAPRVAFIDDRTGAISREWYRFFLSLRSAAEVTQQETSLLVDANSLTASYDAMLADLAQEVNSAPDSSVLLSSYQALLADLAQVVASAPDSNVFTASLESQFYTFQNDVLVAPPSLFGAVTSVGASGGTTGLTFTGSPITTSGTLTLSGTLGIANGGTNSTGTPPAGGVAYGTGTAIVVNAAGPAGYVLTSGGAAPPVWTPVASLAVGTEAYWGSFWDTTTQTAATINTAYALTLNSADVENNGVTIVSGSRVTFIHAGVYSLTFSVQLTNTDNANAAHIANIWIRKNGTDVIATDSKFTVPGKFGAVQGAVIGTVNFVLPIAANDYIQLVWSTDDTSLSVASFPAGTTPVSPVVPSVIFTAVAAAPVGLGYAGVVSVTSLTISTGSKVLTVNTNATDTAFIVGNRVRLVNSAVNYMDGVITAYSGTSMTVLVDGIAGSGTYTSWAVSLTGSVGGVTSFAGNSTGLTPTAATTGAISLAGTLNVLNGGTGVTTSTGSGSTVLSASPTFTGTVAAAAITTTGAVTVGTSLTTTADGSGITTLGRYSAGYAYSLVRPDAAATGIEFRSNAGTQQLTIVQATGNVGIGVSAPVAKLVVNSGAVGLVAAFSDGIAQSLRISTGSGYVALLNPNAGAITFRNSADSVEFIRVDSTGSVGIGTTANASALLDVQSTTKGVRMPNMTTTQKNAISGPAAGLMVFDTTLAKLCVYSGAAWQTVTSI